MTLTRKAVCSAEVSSGFQSAKANAGAGPLFTLKKKISNNKPKNVSKFKILAQLRAEQRLDFELGTDLLASTPRSCGGGLTDSRFSNSLTHSTRNTYSSQP